MRIKQISVHGLFGIFDHVIPLNVDERITIIHGLNGFGKTAILKILNNVFNSEYAELENIPFTKFSIELDDGSIVEILKPIKDSEESEKIELTLNFHNGESETQTFSPGQKESSSDESKSPITTATNNTTERTLSRFIDHVYDTSNLRWKLSFAKQDPDWLKNVKNHVPIHFIESQRLLNIIPDRSSNNLNRSPWMQTVSAYSEELAKLMQDKFKEYGKTSQSLDRTFPMRVMKQKQSTEVTDSQLRQKLEELEDTRADLISVGLLDRDENSDFKIQPQDIDESTKNALSVYVEDTEKKLNVFDDIAKKIDLFKRIINQKFSYSYKEINFSKEKGFIFTTTNSSLSNNKQLLPIYLSSGEQHELVLLYELLFKVKPKSLVLIDEPELSLHVGWQVQFLEDLQEITQLANLDILMATHSPGIIQDRWDLTVELKRPDQ